MAVVRWFCRECKLAGTSRDVVCCANALIAAAEVDRQVWYRLRLGMKSEQVHRGILWTRASPTHARTVLTEAAERSGKQWVELRAVAGRKKAA